MRPAIVPIFVSSTRLDLEPEREVIDQLLRRFKDAKFVGMEYFGSDDPTTREASLKAVGDSDVYVGIIGGRYGSGITEAEYDAARARQLPCLVYLKEEASIEEQARDKEPEKRALLAKFKEKLRDQQSGHLVAAFARPSDLAVLVAANLHNWLFENSLAPALADADQRAADHTLGDRLARFADRNRELLDLVGEDRELSPEKRRLALDLLYKLTYEVREQLLGVPGLAQRREEIASANLRALERLVALDPQDHEALRELATNWRLVGEVRFERSDWSGAREAFQQSADRCATLLTLAPGTALYHRDHGVSHFNLGLILQQQPGPDPTGAQREYRIAVRSVQRAAELDSRWRDERDQIEAAVASAGAGTTSTGGGR
jgi:hypothetical protein